LRSLKKLNSQGKIKMKNMKKGEDRTFLTGTRLVSKKHKRIAFRGSIDIMEAETLEAQILAESLGEEYYRNCLGEILEYLRAIIAAEVKGTPLGPFSLAGIDADEIHRQTHDVKASFDLPGHPLPDHTIGPMAARLNLLRAKVREGELLAVRVFGGPFGKRPDIITAMNRLSSAFWWLICRHIADNRLKGH
jgi:ethanolamine utilization cobalamin adenosyltransferase